MWNRSSGITTVHLRFKHRRTFWPPETDLLSIGSHGVSRYRAITHRTAPQLMSAMITWSIGRDGNPFIRGYDNIRCFAWGNNKDHCLFGRATERPGPSWNAVPLQILPDLAFYLLAHYLTTLLWTSVVVCICAWFRSLSTTTDTRPWTTNHPTSCRTHKSPRALPTNRLALYSIWIGTKVGYKRSALAPFIRLQSFYLSFVSWHVFGPT